MSVRFARGLVVGKFAPLHQGHELVINKAHELCDEVVLVSYTSEERPHCEAGTRARWLAQLFPKASRLVLDAASWRDLAKTLPELPPEMPLESDPELIHRRAVACLCERVLGGRVDAVFTSEAYGDGFAQELTQYFRRREPDAPEVRHVLVDAQRRVVPISATRILADVHAHHAFLSPCVYGSFVGRVCILGGESTGKTTLARALADRLGTGFVAEYGRELWVQRSGKLAFEDLLHIAEVQVVREEEAAGHARRWLVCDTSPLTTLFYSLHLFGRADPRLEALAARRYELTVLCVPDIPFVQDGTREAGLREQQDAWYRERLARRGTIPLEAKGPVEIRVRQVVEAMLPDSVGDLFLPGARG